MSDAFECFDCKKVTPLAASAHDKCPRCGSVNGRTLTGADVVKGVKAGVYIDKIRNSHKQRDK